MKTFTEFLMPYCMSVEMTIDDLLPEIYAWIKSCDPELIVELAEKWHKEQTKVEYDFSSEIVSAIESTGLAMIKIGDRLYKVTSANEDPKTIEQVVDKHYDAIFKWLCDTYDTAIHDLIVEVRVGNEGKTIRRSWKDREDMLDAENDRQIKFDKLMHKEPEWKVEDCRNPKYHEPSAWRS